MTDAVMRKNKSPRRNTVGHKMRGLRLEPREDRPSEDKGPVSQSPRERRFKIDRTVYTDLVLYRGKQLLHHYIRKYG